MSSFSHILVPTDFGAAAEAALDLAIDLANKLGCKVTLLHVAWLPPSYAATNAQGLAWSPDELDGEAAHKLADAVSHAKQRLQRVEGHAAAGSDPAEQILDAAKTRGADLVVMGTHGRRGLTRFVLGSIAERVVRLSPLPVMTVSAREAAAS